MNITVFCPGGDSDEALAAALIAPLLQKSYWGDVVFFFSSVQKRRDFFHFVGAGFKRCFDALCALKTLCVET